MGSTITPAFAELLQTAVTQPGILSSAYSQFHNYSLGNVLLAAFQCQARGIALGPMATYPRWQELGLHVRKGEKAITLCQPVAIRREGEAAGNDDTVIVRFTYRPHWFVLAQTDGADVPPADVPGWEASRALAAFDVVETPFDAIDGNLMGYAKGREISISPVNPLPHKTRFHELAHVLLGHTAEAAQADTDATPRSLKEAEAEGVALLCCEALGLPGADCCRGYIQHWLAGNPIPERSAQRIFRVADQIIRAGRPAAEAETEGGRP
jgi:antirestriction protein ArdC